MASPQPRGRDPQSQKVADDSKRRAIPASKVGVTLTISDKALKEIEQIQEEAIKAAQQDRKFAWR